MTDKKIENLRKQAQYVGAAAEASVDCALNGTTTVHDVWMDIMGHLTPEQTTKVRKMMVTQFLAGCLMVIRDKQVYKSITAYNKVMTYDLGKRPKVVIR